MGAGAKTHWNCGHERTPENTEYEIRRDRANERCVARCRECRRAIGRETKHRKRLRFLEHRMSYLPKQLEATRRKLVMLEREARRYGMLHLLEGQS